MMVDDTSNQRAWTSYIPLHGLAISGLIAVVALGLWVVPTARAWFWFIPDRASWIIFWLVVAILGSSAYYFVRMIVTAIDLRHVSFDRVKVILAGILLYLAGAFLLGKLAIAPPIESWSLTSPATITFFILYTSFVVIAIYLFQSNALRSTWPALVNSLSRINTAALWTIIQIAILIIVPAIILAKLQLAPVSPDISTWFARDQLINTLVFFGIYAFAVLLLFIIGKPLVGLIAYLFRPVAPSDPSYDLYGPNIAWWIRLSIMFTIIAQFICFFTAYFGLKLLLSEEGVTSIEVLSFHIPHQVADLLNLGGDTIAWTQLQLISLVVAFILSAGIAYFAAMTIENLLEGHPVSWPLPILVVVLGLLSTYCGFTMWNGAAATAEELRHGIQATKSLVDQFRDIDDKTLGAAAGDAEAQVSALERRVEEDERDRLEAQFDDLNKAILAQESSYQALAAATLSFDGNATQFAKMGDNERLTGASSLVPGYGTVARELQRISRAYKTAADSASEIQKTHDQIKSDLGKLGADSYADIVKKAPLDTLQNDLHAMQAKASDFSNIDLRPVLDNLEGQLKQPLPPIFSSAAGIQSAQIEALRSIKDNLSHQAVRIGDVVAANPRTSPGADHEDASSQANGQIAEGNALVEDLAVFVKDITSLNDRRAQDRGAIVEQLDQSLGSIDSDSKEGTLYFDRADIVNSIGEARSDLSKLAFVDTDSLDNTLAKINSEIGKLDAKSSGVNEYIKVIDTGRIAKLIPKAASYPAVPEFQLTPLALGVLKFFYLSLPLLLIQVFIDFGYTIGLIFGVSSMHRRPGGMSSGGFSSGGLSTAAPAPAPAPARIVKTR